MTGGSEEYTRAEDGSFTAPLTLFYPYARTLGPTYGRFLTSLRECRIFGTRGHDGRVFVPPAEFDPVSGDPCTEWVEVAAEGTILTWSWQPSPLEGNPLDRPFAWALVQLDGADVGLLHVIDAPGPDALQTGARVRARWAEEPTGAITDIACFELVATADAPAP
ncbi:MAG TPA: OB-fold domain-containing protein [Ilumatobacteraceae bacterium]